MDKPQKHYALYLQSTWRVSDDQTRRKQYIILPPLSPGPGVPVGAQGFRYFRREQLDTKSKRRWSGPFGVDVSNTEWLVNGVLSNFLSPPIGNYEISPPIVVEVTREELLELAPRHGKKTLYAVIDRAKKVARRKHGFAI